MRVYGIQQYMRTSSGSQDIVQVAKQQIGILEDSRNWSWYGLQAE